MKFINPAGSLALATSYQKWLRGTGLRKFGDLKVEVPKCSLSTKPWRLQRMY
jgi:hypothetical protein